VKNYLVLGAGTVGTLLATRLAELGHNVAVASRSGSTAPGAKALQIDAADAVAVSSASAGVDTIFLATSPTQYHRWESLWPPMFTAAIEAARTSQAKLVMVGNLYAYGENTTMPMTETSPLLTNETKGLVRKAGWELARGATARGEIRAAEVRASDYFGPGAGKHAQLGSGFFAPVLRGKSVKVFGDPDVAHSWTYLEDIVSTLIATSDHAGNWGRAWHVPTNAPLTRTQIANQVNRLTGRHASLEPYSGALLRTLGVFSPSIRAANDSAYQVNKPFILDSSDTESLLGVQPTPWDDALATTVDWYRQNA